jgi:hypothetical protein
MVMQPVQPKPKRGGGCLPWALLALVVAGGLMYLGVRATGIGLLSTFSGPQQLYKQRKVLKEGQYFDVVLRNERPRRITVELSASPKNVNLLTLDDGNFLAWKNAQSISGGQFKYNAQLTSRGTIGTKNDGLLGEGTWHVVVQRPRESLVFTDDTTVDVSIIGY